MEPTTAPPAVEMAVGAWVLTVPLPPLVMVGLPVATVAVVDAVALMGAGSVVGSRTVVVSTTDRVAGGEAELAEESVLTGAAEPDDELPPARTAAQNFSVAGMTWPMVHSVSQ